MPSLPDQVDVGLAPPACTQAVLEQVRQAVIEGFRAVGHGGLEVGGVLFGKISTAGLIVEASRPLVSEHAFGPSLRLSENDQVALELLKDDRNGELAGLEAVGWYRSYTRSELAANEADRAVMDRHFAESGCLLFLLKPVGIHNAIGSFFIRDAHGDLLAADAEQLVLRPALPFLNDDPPLQPVLTQLEQAVPAVPLVAKRRRRAPKLAFAGLAFTGLAAICLFAWQNLHRTPILTLSITPGTDGSQAIVTWSDTDRNAERGRLTVQGTEARFSTDLPEANVRHGLAVVPLVDGEMRVTVKIWDSSGAEMEREARFDAPRKQTTMRPSEYQEQIEELTVRNRRLEETVSVLRQRLEHQDHPEKRLAHSRFRR